MTAATLTSTGIGSMAFRPGSTGLSGAAVDLAHRLGGHLSNLREPLSLGGQYAEALNSLADLAREAAQPDWDGHGAAAIQMGSVQHARKLVRALPTNFPAPEVAADPDGEVSVEWYRSPNWVFSISVGQEGTLTYAGRFGRVNRVRGIEEGMTDELPSKIMVYLDHLLSVSV